MTEVFVRQVQKHILSLLLLHFDRANLDFHILDDYVGFVDK